MEYENNLSVKPKVLLWGGMRMAEDRVARNLALEVNHGAARVIYDNGKVKVQGQHQSSRKDRLGVHDGLGEPWPC